MIVTSNTTTTNQSTKSATTTERVMANTMSVDEYFDELISLIQQEMVKESLTRAFDDLHAGRLHKDARNLFK